MNLRVADELAKQPPTWADPLGWRMAIEYMVEHCDRDRPIPPLNLGAWWYERECCEVLRRYHCAREGGAAPDEAMQSAAFKDGLTGFAAGLMEAYERGMSWVPRPFTPSAIPAHDPLGE